METVLLIVTVISMVIALVMSTTAWRLARDEKRRSAARVAALSIAATSTPSGSGSYGGQGLSPDAIGFQARQAVAEKPLARPPWAPAPLAMEPRSAPPAGPPVSEMTLNAASSAREVSPHASGFLGASSAPVQESGGRQRVLAGVAAVLFVGLLGGLVWMMSNPRGTSAAAVGPNSPLELVSLRHDRKNDKLAVSGLVRNPVAGKPVERLSAVVFLFDRQGAFVTSGKTNVDFLKLGAGDESPFVVTLDAPATVARYRVSFRTDDGVVPHIDRRGAPPLATEGEQPVSVILK
jgi:hypothetical protein